MDSLPYIIYIYIVEDLNSWANISQKKNDSLDEEKQIHPINFSNYMFHPSVFSKKTNRIPKGGCPRGGGNWGTLRFPREDWGTLGNLRDLREY